MALDQTELAQIVSAVIQALKVGDTGAKTAPAAKPGNSLEAKDRALIAGLVRKGIKREDIKLMDRANPAADYNVRPFKGWLDLGRQVNKGQHGIRGLFHISQTSPIAPKAPAKPGPKVKIKPAQNKPAQLPLA
jgi:hypothetical protein